MKSIVDTFISNELRKRSWTEAGNVHISRWPVSTRNKRARFIGDEEGSENGEVLFVLSRLGFLMKFSCQRHVQCV